MEASDHGLPPLSDFITVRVKVQRNINSPVFSEPTVNISLPENRPTGTLVATVTATDADDVSDNEGDKMIIILAILVPWAAYESCVLFV